MTVPSGPSRLMACVFWLHPVTETESVGDSDRVWVSLSAVQTAFCNDTTTPALNLDLSPVNFALCSLTFQPHHPLLLRP